MHFKGLGARNLSDNKSQMKIILYSQNIWGVGHFFRSLEICRALSQHEVILIIGGDRVDVPLPPHVRPIQLPPIMTDREYRRLFTTEPGLSLEQAKRLRKDRLFRLIGEEAPDIFVVELYPFGRNAFRFELDPVLEGIRKKALPRCFVVCSLRDILVEKKDQESYEKRVVRNLNRYFDALLIHSDPEVLPLELTFSRMAEITIPIRYTGYVAQKPPQATRSELRRRLGIGENEVLIVVSAGGGKAGAVLIRSVIAAYHNLRIQKPSRLCAFAGPYMSQADFDRIKQKSEKGVYFSRFSNEFLSYLKSADLSVSMAGYNTSMNILATGVPAAVWPFSRDREQVLRAKRLWRLGALTILKETDLKPASLSAIMGFMLSHPPQHLARIDLNGANKTAALLVELSGN